MIAGQDDHRAPELSKACKNFRDTLGRIGLLDVHCAHRGTSLYHGRNEEGGLRCIYHGWKYDFEGNVVDTPAEPESSALGPKGKQVSYPCHEVAGVIVGGMR